MIYGSITNCTVVGHGVRSEWECRLGYQIISENTATNTREIKLQLEARTIHSKYTAVGNQLTPTIDGVPLNTIGMNFSSSNVNVWQVLGTRTIAIVGAFNGIKTGSFTTNLTADWGLKSGSASVTINLANLHTSPVVTKVTMQEKNSLVNSYAGIVQFLSSKTITFTTTTYDNATISSYQVYHNGVLIGSSTANGMTIDFDKVGTLITFPMNNKTYCTLRFVVIDSYGTSGYLESQYEVIPYVKPNLVQTSSSVKRNGQLSGKVKLNLVGSFYNQKVNDVANTIKLEFTYWKKGETEATTYYDIPFNATDNSIALYDWNVVKNGTEITDVNKDFAYYFKIRATDNFNKQSEMLLLCPVGEYLWAEFKDRVDFKNITIKGQNPFIYSYDETWIGTHNGKNLYRKTIDCGNLPNKGLKNVSHGIPNINYVRHIEGRAADGNGGGFDLPRTHTTSSLCVVLEYDKNNVVLYDQYDFSSYKGEATIEYTKASGYLIHGNSKQETTTGENLINPNSIERNYSYNFGDTGKIPVKTYNTTRAAIGVDNLIEIKANTTYTFSIKQGYRYAIAQLESDKKSLGDTGWIVANTDATKIFTTKSNAKYIGFNLSKADTSVISDADFEDLKRSMQLEEGANPNPTYPQPIEVVNSVKIKVDNGAGEQQETTIDLKGNCVSKINNIQDYLLICRNKCWLVKKVGKVVLDGTQFIQRYIGKENYIFCFELEKKAKSSGSVEKIGLLSNKYKEETRDSIWSHNKYGFSYGSSNYYYKDLVFYSEETKKMTSDEFKQWVINQYNNGEPIIVYYELATPEIIDLGELPQEVKVFDGTNNVQLISNLDTSIEVTDNFNLDTYL